MLNMVQPVYRIPKHALKGRSYHIQTTVTIKKKSRPKQTEVEKIKNDKSP